MTDPELNHEKNPFASPRLAYSQYKNAAVRDIECDTNPSNHDIIIALFMFSDFTENQIDNLQKDVNALKAEVRRLRPGS